MERTDLIKSVGNLLELKMNSLLKERGVELQKNPDPTSQQYFYTLNNKISTLSDEELAEIFNMFKQNFATTGLGCTLFTACLYFGIAHLSTDELKTTIKTLQS